jgi:hypothetical protein
VEDREDEEDLEDSQLGVVVGEGLERLQVVVGQACARLDPDLRVREEGWARGAPDLVEGGTGAGSSSSPVAWIHLQVLRVGGYGH